MGAVLAVVGIAFGFWEQLSANVPLLSLLALVGAAACFAEAGVLGKMIPGVHPVTTNALALGIGGVGLFVLSVVVGEKHELPSLAVTWGALAYLVGAGSVLLFGGYIFVLRRWTASATSYQNVLFPFVTVVLAALLLGEPVTWPLVVGGLLVLAGVMVGTSSGERKVGENKRPVMATEGASDE